MQKLFSSMFDAAARVLRGLVARIQFLFASLHGAINAFPQAVGRLIKSLPSLPRQLGVWFGDVTLSFTSMVIVVYKRLRHNICLSVSALLGIVVILGLSSVCQYFLTPFQARCSIPSFRLKWKPLTVVFSACMFIMSTIRINPP